MDESWHLKPTAAHAGWFKDPKFVADALRKMVENCTSLHPVGRGLYTDGERKAMTAAADLLDDFVKRTAN